MKLNELVAALHGASNRLIDAESLSGKELGILHAHFHRLAHMARQEGDLLASHSIDEADARHSAKRDRQRKSAAAKP